MKIDETSLPGVLLLTPDIFRDSRGAFWETWNPRTMIEAGFPSTWTQDNFSISKENVVRGIHYQLDHPQGKLVRVTHGAALDVAVDLRRSSPYFAKYVAVKLTGESGQMLWIPEGFGHAFLSLTDVTGIAYKVTGKYSRAGERTILWNDPHIAIPWPIDPNLAILSDKDRKGFSLRDAEVFA